MDNENEGELIIERVYENLREVRVSTDVTNLRARCVEISVRAEDGSYYYITVVVMPDPLLSEMKVRKSSLNPLRHPRG